MLFRQVEDCVRRLYRGRGITWQDVVRETGLDKARAYNALTTCRRNGVLANAGTNCWHPVDAEQPSDAGKMPAQVAEAVAKLFNGRALVTAAEVAESLGWTPPQAWRALTIAHSRGLVARRGRQSGWLPPGVDVMQVCTPQISETVKVVEKLANGNGKRITTREFAAAAGISHRLAADRLCRAAAGGKLKRAEIGKYCLV